MKSETAARTYRMRARADAAEQTGRGILAAASALWREKGLDEVTLQELAARAGVSVQTVIRRFGSKEGAFGAAIEADASGIEAERDVAPVGDVDGALAILLSHYERDGDAVLRTLALEGRLAAADAIVQRGRKAHRQWCARVFAPYLPAPTAAGYAVRLDAVVAATDIYVWKLFRRDLGRSAGRTRQVVSTLVWGLLSAGRPCGDHGSVSHQSVRDLFDDTHTPRRIQRWSTISTSRRTVSSSGGWRCS